MIEPTEEQVRAYMDPHGRVSRYDAEQKALLDCVRAAINDERDNLTTEFETRLLDIVEAITRML